MSFFWIFTLLLIGATGGYIIGHDCGEHEGWLKAQAHFFKANR